MLATKQRNVPKADIRIGEFNNCEHLFVQLDEGKHQTISVRMPNGNFVTFAFVPSEGEEFECVDIHSTAGKHWTDETTLGKDHYKQVAIGFSKGDNTFDTRKCKGDTSLLTLLLNSRYHKEGQ